MHFRAVGKDYLACGNARRDLCSNRSRVRRGPLGARVLDALARRLMRPALVEAFVAAFTKEWNRLAAEAGAARTAHREELAVERKVANLVDAIADGLRAEGLRERLASPEARREALRRDLAEAPPAARRPPPAAPALHPNLAAVYRDRVAGLERALSAGDAPDALEAARAR